MLLRALICLILSSANGYRFPSSLLGSHTTNQVISDRRRALRAQNLLSDAEPSAVAEDLTSSSQAVKDGKIGKVVKGLIRLSKSLAMNVYVDTDIRIHLNMKNSERKARILLPQEVESITVNSLRDYVDKKFPSLTGQPYILRYQLHNDMASPKQFKGKLLD